MHLTTCEIPCKILVFHAPRSFTGENVAEIHISGSQAVLQATIEKLLKTGVRMAGAGEFTRIAFENGKLDINQAQGVLDLIHSQDRSSRKAALFALNGGLSSDVNSARSKLLEVLYRLEANLDFSEEDIEIIPVDELQKSVAEIKMYLDSVLENTKTHDNSSPMVVIAGPVNSGKSTLFNRMSSERALVSAIPGTTRDALKSEVVWNGVSIELWDTAGAGLFDNQIDEAAGEMAENLVASADLVLFVISPDAIGNKILSEFSKFQCPHICVVNKCDTFDADSLKGEKAIEKLRNASLLKESERPLFLSATRGDSVDSLKTQILKKLSIVSGGGRVHLSQWQREGIFRAWEETKDVLRTVEEGIPQEITALSLRCAVEALDILEGSHITDELLDRIFSNFCIGK